MGAGRRGAVAGLCSGFTRRLVGRIVAAVLLWVLSSRLQGHVYCLADGMTPNNAEQRISDRVRIGAMRPEESAAQERRLIHRPQPC